jgi:hypothetical protein
MIDFGGSSLDYNKKGAFTEEYWPPEIKEIDLITYDFRIKVELFTVARTL